MLITDVSEVVKHSFFATLIQCFLFFLSKQNSLHLGLLILYVCHCRISRCHPWMQHSWFHNIITSLMSMLWMLVILERYPLLCWEIIYQLVGCFRNILNSSVYKQKVVKQDSFWSVSLYELVCVFHLTNMHILVSAQACVWCTHQSVLSLQNYFFTLKYRVLNKN